MTDRPAEYFSWRRCNALALRASLLARWGFPGGPIAPSRVGIANRPNGGNDD
jgi:hypothetical protein